MAFQSQSVFHGVLQGLASSDALGEQAPAENFLLDERVSTHREQDYFGCTGFAPTPATTTGDWFEKHKTYASKRLRFLPCTATFDVGNEPARLTVNHEMHAVRMETLSGLCERGSVKFADPAELAIAIRELLEARERHEPLADATWDFLTVWLGRLNGASDKRPVFVAPFPEVESILDQPDWANQLRDTLGLSHIGLVGSIPTPVVLFRYNLERPYLEHRATPSWATTPTVLDDPGTSGLSTCFFPSPRKSAAPEYGFTVDLARSGASKSEFLHAPINYTLDDISKIGEVATLVTDDMIAAARQDHFERLRPQYAFHADIPVRT